MHWIKDLFVRLPEFLDMITSTYGTWTYLILFAIIFCETGLVVTPFLPGDSLLFAIGAIAARGSLHIGWLFAILPVAAILGDNINYWIGRFIGPKAFTGHYRLLKKEHLDRTHQFFERHGGKAIILARFVPIVRTFSPFVAGVGAMNYARFIVYSITGGITWIALFLFAGYRFGGEEIVKRNFHLVIMAIIMISLLPMVIEYIRARKGKKGKTGFPSSRE